MCGIGALFHARHPSPPVEPAVLQRINRAQAHRGPDGAGIWREDGIGLAHTRLAIVDLRGGAQPMHDSEGRYVLSYNGEIYNYQALREELLGAGERLRTRSDSEVILALYRRHGPACLHRLRGMFALVIYDRQQRSLFAARDRLGIKPLFYHWDAGRRRLLIASEMKGLFATGLVEPAWDLESLAGYFHHQFSVAPHTPFQGIRELPPGHSLQLSSEGGLRLHPYWDLRFPREDERETETDEAHWLERLDEHFADAVCSHTIGEVPIAAYLSGGIDSASVVWKLRHCLPRQETLRSYSIAFDDPRLDERERIQAIARHLGVDNRLLELHGEPPGGYLPWLEQALYHLEQPQRLAVDLPHLQLSRLTRDDGRKVVFTGDGSDEIFAGYDCFRQDHMRQSGNQQPHQRQQLYLEHFTQYFPPDHMRLLLRLHRPARQRRVERRYGCYPAWYDFWQILAEDAPPLMGPALTPIDPRAQLEALAEELRPRLHGLHPLDRSLYLEAKTRLPGWILWKSDRLAMAHGVEARVPFMDHPLVELATAMPPQFKLNGMDEKYLLRRLALPHLPPQENAYKKQAFYTPIHAWFFASETQRSRLEPYLAPEVLAESGLFQPDAVRALLARQGEPLPDEPNAHYRRMREEWLLMLVLSIQILTRQFIAKEAPCFIDIP